MQHIKNESVFVLPVLQWLLNFAVDPMAQQVVAAVVNELNGPAMLPGWSQLQTTVKKGYSSF